MASLLTHNHGIKAGAKYIRFSRAGQRSMIYLGFVSDRVAQTVKLHVEELLSTRAGGMAPAPATAKWLTGIEPALSQKLADVGLIDAPKTDDETSLGAFLQNYIDGRADVKHWTITNCEQARRNLVKYFTEKRNISTITPGDADEYRRWLIRAEKQGGRGLGENTARRHCGRAKQFFRAAVRKKLIAENPFADMRDCGVRSNRSRDFFVTREMADKVLAICPCTQWKLAFALSRFGGLRCPSEHSALRWADVDWASNRFTVRSPKTEHHEGHDSRIVPIFPELRPYLEAAKAEAKPGAEYVVTLPGVVRCRGCDKASNLGTQMTKFVKRAGLKPWPKLFHNLRATRQTELEGQGHPTHVVCAWLGNSPKVAREHYLRVTEADFEKAKNLIETKPLIETAGGKWEAPGEPLGAPSGSQNGSTPSIAYSSLLSQIVQKAIENGELEQLAATVSNAMQNALMPRVGLEPTTY